MAPAWIAIPIEALAKRGDGLRIRVRLVKRTNCVDATGGALVPFARNGH